MLETEFCTCENKKSVYGASDDFYEWDVCSECDSPIEDSKRPLNHYDGEDHVHYDGD